MKKILVVACLFVSFFVSAQQLPDYDTISLKTKTDYTAEVNGTALSAANYLLTKPIEKDSLQRVKAAKFLYRWMNGSPTFSFPLSEPASKISKENKPMMTIYFAGMAKYSLENPSGSKDSKKVKLNATKMVLEYCKKFEIKMNGELKKMNEAYEKGELEKYLGI